VKLTITVGVEMSFCPQDEANKQKVNPIKARTQRDEKEDGKLFDFMRLSS
jgi:hypothetical protein